MLWYTDFGEVSAGSWTHGLHYPVVQEYSSVHYDMKPKCVCLEIHSIGKVMKLFGRADSSNYLASCSNHEIITSLSSVIFGTFRGGPLFFESS